MAKRPAPKGHPKVTQKHVDNANEIAQILQAMQQSQPAEQPAEPAMPSGVSPLGGQAR